MAMNDLPEPPEPPVSTETRPRMGVQRRDCSSGHRGAAIGYAASDKDTVEASARTVTVTITEPAVPTGPLQSGSTGATGFDRCDCIDH